MPLFVLLDSDPAGLVLMVDIEEDHAVILDLMAEAAPYLHLHPLLTAEFAPVIYEAIVAPADVLLEPAMVLAVHPAVGVGGVIKEPVYHTEDAGMTWRVVFLDPRHLGSKSRDGVIYERRHGSLLTGVNRVECQTQWDFTEIRRIARDTIPIIVSSDDQGHLCLDRDLSYFQLWQ